MSALDQKEPLENTAWRTFSNAHRTVYLHIMSDLRQYGLTPPQYSVLRAIGKSNRGRLNMSEIGKEMVVTFANITTIVDNLEKRHYVRRLRDTTSDRRVIMVELTSKGSSLFRRIFRAHRREICRLMAVLDDTELENLIDYSKRIIENTMKVKDERKRVFSDQK